MHGTTSTTTKGASPLDASEGYRVVILIPVFNDWESVHTLLPMLDSELDAAGLDATVLIVDDGSSLSRPEPDARQRRLEAITEVSILRLRRNVGHERAIAVGIVWVSQNRPGLPLVVMDGDGEDQPSDVPRLLARFRAEGSTFCVFAERRRREESLSFRVFYVGYRLLHRLLTGKSIRIGSFSVISPQTAIALGVVPELWNHYAAALVESRFPIILVPSDRGRRLHGTSHMSLARLVAHGFGAIGVYAEIVATRLLIATSCLLLLGIGAVIAVVSVRLLTESAVPGWATYTVGLLVVTILQLITLSVLLVFSTLGRRPGAVFLPVRDCPYFVAEVESVYSRDE